MVPITIQQATFEIKCSHSDTSQTYIANSDNLNLLKPNWNISLYIHLPYFTSFQWSLLCL